jgi:hypothetical protein
MRRLLLAVLVAGVVTAAATAAPNGFRETSRLQPIAAAVSPGAVVYCSMNATSWAADVEARFPALPWQRIDGYRVAGTSEARFAPWVCRGLEGWLRGKNVPTLKTFAVYALTFSHELMHARGLTDEGAADCAALRAMPAMLRSRFGIKRATTLRTIMRHAWDNHYAKPPAYQGC